MCDAAEASLLVMMTGRLGRRRNPVPHGLTLPRRNQYRYSRTDFGLDSHESYLRSDDGPIRMVPNPANDVGYQEVENTRRAMQHAETFAGRGTLAMSSPPPRAQAGGRRIAQGQ